MYTTINGVKTWVTITKNNYDSQYYGNSVTECYGRPGYAKITAENNILKQMRNNGGYGYHIISYSHFYFSAIWYIKDDKGREISVLELPTKQILFIYSPEKAKRYNDKAKMREIELELLAEEASILAAEEAEKEAKDKDAEAQLLRDYYASI